MNPAPTPASQPETPALLVIDVQRALFEKSTPVYQAEALLENILTLVAQAHAAGAPVFYVQHCDQKALQEETGGWQLHPRLQTLPEDGRIRKRHGSAFEDTPLEGELRRREVRDVVVAGLVTHGCVRATCQDALRRGFRVVLAEDAHSSYSKDAPALIEKWGQALAGEGVALEPTRQIRFGGRPADPARGRALAALQDDWGSYPERFDRLAPAAQAAYLEGQGYARFADLLAHVIAWWEACDRDLQPVLAGSAISNPEVEVDRFNARAVARFRDRDEAAVRRVFAAARAALIERILCLPEPAFADPQLAKRLGMETWGHLREHALPGSAD